MAVEVKLPAVLDIIRDNILKYGNPLALKGSEIAAWAKPLNLPATGELLFYTGGEYQLLPFIDSLVKTLTHMDQGSKGFSLMMGARNLLSKAGINAEKMYASVLAKDKDRFNAISYKAAVVLQKLGYDLCYAGEAELYSGALLHELGFQRDLPAFARRVAGVLKASGAKAIVCLSPHAAEIFKLVYPELGIELPGMEIITFVELVWQRRDQLPTLSGSHPVVIHDSCRLARELDITVELREIMQSMHVPVQEAACNGKWTTCCGGPGKLLFPEISHIIAGRRRQELEETGAALILTACPYCLAALEGATGPDSTATEDLIEFVYGGMTR